MKKNNKIILNELRYNRCSILLDEVSKKYLNEEINSLSRSNKLNLTKIEELIENIYINNDIRYFSSNHITAISKDILDRVKKKLNEEPGRNLHTVNKNPIGNETILTLNTLKSADDSDSVFKSIEATICPNTGKWTVTYIIDKSREVKYFNSEAESNLFIQNLRKF